MNKNLLVDVTNEIEMSKPDSKHNLEKLTKEELIEQCHTFISLARKSKETKEDTVKENERLEKEKRELEEKLEDLQFENDVLKDRIVKVQETMDDDDLLSHIPLVQHSEDNERQNRAGCLWRLSNYFRRNN